MATLTDTDGEYSFEGLSPGSYIEIYGNLIGTNVHDAIGLADLADIDGLMAGVLQPGTRHLPNLADIDEVLAGDDWLK